MSMRLLKWDETGRVGGADTWATVGNWLVRDSELSEVVADHFRLGGSSGGRHKEHTH